jgi:NAD(P)-dependent dehydrogenase (short-subunit alcohol dehydrogenase family)
VGLVTGGGSGIGRGVALAFAAAGATVFVVDIDAHGAAETIQIIRQAGGRADAVSADVSKAEDVQSMVAGIVAAAGRLDFAINNAAIEIEKTALLDCPDETFDRLMAVNVRGVFLCLKHQLRQMQQQNEGAIVNIASVNSFRPQPHQAVYTATKHAVLGLTRTAAIEAAPAGVRINAICPGAIETPMLEMSLAALPIPRQQVIDMMSLVGRFGRPDEVAKAALWLCSADASFTYGHALAVDGGYLAR